MEKLIKFIILFTLAAIPFRQMFAATDYASLNSEINASSANPASNNIFLSTHTITLGGSIALISDKTINFIAGITIIDGAGQYNGFTASAGSNISFTGINFQNAKNTADGAFLNLNASTASFNDSVAFTNGNAVIGGAMAIRNSFVHFSSDALFGSNFAVNLGGGFYSENSVFEFDGNAEFNANKSEYMGGGFYADAGSVISFNADASFKNNFAEYNNGAGFYARRSTITFNSASFENNISYDIGGGFYSSMSNIIFAGSVTFTANSAKNSGGGADITNNSNAIFEGNVSFSSNTADNGAALMVYESAVSFQETAEFKNNSAAIGGGAVYINAGTMNLSDAVFDGNTAGTAGGAVYIVGVSTSLQGRLTVNTSSQTVFKNNKAGGKSNALYLSSYSLVEFNTASGAAVEMYDSITGSGNNSNLTVSGNGAFNFYGNLDIVDINLLSGSSFNLKSGGKINAGILSIGNGARFDSVNNTADTIKVSSLNIDGTLAMEIHAALNTSDRIISSGNVNIGASSILEITTDISDPATFRKKTYKLINAQQNINGAFASVWVTTPSFTNSPEIGYGTVFDKWITLTLVGDSLTTGFSSLSGLSFNQKQTAKTYDALSASSSGDLDAIISVIEGLDENGQKKALAQASGYFLANVIRSVGVDFENNEIYDRIKNHCIYRQTESAVWAQLRGAATTYSKDGNSLNDFNDASNGVMIGFDKFVENNDMLMFGVYGKYNTHDIKQGSNRADITDKGLGVYGGLIHKEWEIKSLIFGSYNSYSTKRSIAFADRNTNADFDGTTFGIDVEGAMKFEVDQYTNIRPYAGLEAKNTHYNGFKEKGAESLSLKVSEDSYARSAIRTGAGAVYDDNLFSWYINGELKYLLTGVYPEIESIFEGSDLIFKSRGAEEGRLIFGAIAGASVRIIKELKIFVNGSIYRAEHFQNLYGNIGLRWNFCSHTGERKPPKSKPERVNSSDFLSPDNAEPIETDAVITEEAPLTSDEFDAAGFLLNAQQQPAQEDEFDAAEFLRNASQQPEPAEEPVKEINMDDAAVVEEQQKEAALRRSKPVLKSFSLNMANFDTGKAVLTEKAKENIRLQAEEIKKFDFTKITIEGHSDSTGSAELNKSLSRERARAVFDVFAEAGIPARKMSYIGFSSLLPAASNATIEGRAANRRVEIFVE
ncbi:MAG: autotransporter domain-containing protein [Endomicrobia bacterium]|nr:autotransporter domain-containing protein [Endomicrobiia bacterium]